MSGKEMQIKFSIFSNVSKITASAIVIAATVVYWSLTVSFVNVEGVIVRLLQCMACCNAGAVFGWAKSA